MLKEKALNFWLKLPNLDTFLDCNLKQKNCCIILNQQAQISQSTVSCNKQACWNWDQNWLISLILGQSLKKLLPYLKSAPSSLSKCKVSCWREKRPDQVG